MGKLFWIFVGATLALWGRHKTVKTIDKHVPAQVTESVKKAGASAKTFVGEVAKTQQQARQYLSERKAKEVDVRDENGRDETGTDAD